MSRVLPEVSEPAAGAVDGFGRRSHEVDPGNGEEEELLELSATLVEHAGFVAALGERVARFATVRHASYVHLRRLDRPSADRLVLVSDHTPGWRLSELLTASTTVGLPIDITGVISLLRQLLPAVALFGRHNRDAAIGALAPERLIVTPQGRLVIAEHAFGPALDKLNLSRERLWRDYRVCMAPSPDSPRSNASGDAHAMGVIALSLLLGRVLRDDEYPGALPSLLAAAGECRDGHVTPVSKPLASWLTRALQIEPGSAFQSPHEAQVAFESVLASDRDYVTSSKSLDTWVTTVGTTIERSRMPLVIPPPVEIAVDYVSPVEIRPELAAPSTEASPSREFVPERATASPANNKLVLALIGLALVQSVAVAWLWNRDPGAPRAGEGELVVQSRPVAARVSIDGEERGVTPLTLSLPSGAHVLEVQSGKSEPRVIPLAIRAGVQTAQYIELQNVAMTGSLDIRSDPSGARVTIDGQARGTTPVTVRDLAPGEHQVVIDARGRKVTQTVRVDAGLTAQLVVPLPRR
jgi:hypothetical protein